VLQSASAADSAASGLSDLQKLFGHHSLDDATIAALDQIFAALGDHE
jgi:hypothetical protein